MGRNFEELDHRSSDIGDISLRRRRIPEHSDADVFEVKLGDEFLMSSLFTEGEVALANCGLESLAAHHDTPADVVVGGLGLGYTARAALNFPGIKSVVVVEALAPVIEWHEKSLVPLGEELTSNPNCRFVHGDFFSMASPSGVGFDPDMPGRQFDAILLDIDHSPQSLLDPRSAEFYTPAGLGRVAGYIKPHGVFAMWSNDPPADAFLKDLSTVFVTSKAHVVEFQNPMTGEDSASTIYVSLFPRRHQTSS